MAETTETFDFRKLPRRQYEAMAQLAVDNDEGIHPRTFEALERRGLVASREAVLSGRFPVTFRQYFMPTPVHAAWCQHCSDLVQSGQLSEDE